MSEIHLCDGNKFLWLHEGNISESLFPPLVIKHESSALCFTFVLTHFKIEMHYAKSVHAINQK